MRRSILFVLAVGLSLGGANPLVNAQAPTTSQSPQASEPNSSFPPAAVLADIQELKLQLKAQGTSQQTIHDWIEVLASVVIVASLLAFALQIWTLFSDAKNRRRNEEERHIQAENTREYHQIQNTREAQLHEKFLSVLNITIQSAERSQKKVEDLEEKGIKRAGETLDLINNLLTITERSAAKAAGAQYDFLARTIVSLDSECKTLVFNATKEDDRDIIAKPSFSEQVRVLTNQIDSLDHQISTYNASVPPQFRAKEEDGIRNGLDSGVGSGWGRLSLTGPCLFIRGQNHLQLQNFRSAIDDWKLALAAQGADAIRVDANYWIGYLNNTLGNFDSAPEFLKAAAEVASEPKKPELMRLELETRFFSLDYDQVPADIVQSGTAIFDTLQSYKVPKRTISSFATTLGNIVLIQNLRKAIETGGSFDPALSSVWFERAIETVYRSRWAHFGKCQSLILSGKKLDEQARNEVKYVIESVQREYQARIEDRSKVLSKVTEYICMVMIGDSDVNKMSNVAFAVEQHASAVRARTIYSQFRKQNVDKSVFLREFDSLQKNKDLKETFWMANTRPSGSASSPNSKAE